jgi:hypothetical protein
MHIPQPPGLPAAPAHWRPSSPLNAPASTPSVPRVLASLAAMLLLACAAALGAADAELMLRASPALVVPTLGAVVLTAPALLAVHQFLGLDAAPERMIAALARAVDHGGRIALGLVPLALFFAVTTGLWPLVLAAAVVLPGLAMTAVALLGLREAETAAEVMPPRFALLLVGWAVLWLAIAVRICVSMAQLVIGGYA